RYDVIVRTVAEQLPDADILVALHARRSHGAVKAWCERVPRRPCVVVLTGTDLYRDVPARNAEALASLHLADRLVLLQERAVASFPERYRAKAAVVYQSAPALPPAPKSARQLRALFVGHLREEKDPLTFARAAAALAARRDIGFAIVGGVLDAKLAQAVRRVARRCPNLASVGALSHAAARQRIRRAHVLVVPSRMEGGADVSVEAGMAGPAVLASDGDGNVGMLGARYPGYFATGDAQALAELLARCRDDPAFLPRLERLCAERAKLFRPQAERRALASLFAGCLERRRDEPSMRAVAKKRAAAGESALGPRLLQGG